MPIGLTIIIVGTAIQLALLILALCRVIRQGWVGYSWEFISLGCMIVGDVLLHLWAWLVVWGLVLAHLSYRAYRFSRRTTARG